MVLPVTAEEGTAFRFHTAEGPASVASEINGAASTESVWRIEFGRPATAIGPVTQPNATMVEPPPVREASVAQIVPSPIVQANMSLDLPQQVASRYQTELPSILIARRSQAEEVSPSPPPTNPFSAPDWQGRPYTTMSAVIELPPGQLPRDFAAERLAEELPGPPVTLSTLRGWAMMDYDWVATAFCHRPLYFEEINLERYGYGCNAYLQPAASAAHFFGTVPALPYCMAIDCPRECVYTLGHYRPGSPNPWRRVSVPKRLRAAFAEGGVWTGMIFLIP